MATTEIFAIVGIVVAAAIFVPILFDENPGAFLENALCTIFTPGSGTNTTCNAIKGNVTFIGDFPIVITANNSANEITWSFGQLGNASHSNIGGGAEVFKNETGGLAILRTLVSDSPAIIITELGETIEFDFGGGTPQGDPALQSISQGTPGNVVYNATTDGANITVIGDGIAISNASSLVFSINATIGRLNDVNTTDLDENQFLIFNITSEQFENKPISALLRLKDTYFNAEEATVDDLTGVDCVNDVTFSLFANSDINQYRRQAIEFCPDAEDDDNFTWLYVVPKIITGTPEFNFKLFWSDDDTDADSFMKRVDVDDDDAEQSIGPLNPGDMSLTSSDLELHAENFEIPADDHDLVGMRWTNVTIPSGVTILNATIQFHVDETNPNDPIIVRFKGHDIDDAPQFTSTDFDISSRTNTTAFVDWNIPDWVDVSDEGPAQETPNLATIVQEIIDRPGWVSGNAMVIKTTEWIGCTITSCPVNFGLRHAESFDGESSSAPQLKVFWSVGGGGNPDPVCFEFSLLRLTNTQDMNGDFTQRMTVCENRSGSDNLSITEFDIDNHDLEPEDLVILRIHRPNDFVVNDFESNVFVFGGELQWLD